MKINSMMKIMKLSQKGLLILGFAASSFAATSKDQIDAVNQSYNDSLEVIMKSANTNTASNLYTPVGFKGAFIGRAYDAQLFDVPQYANAFRSRTQLDGDLNLYVTANPNPFFTLWTTLTFGFDYTPEYFNERATQSNYYGEDKQTYNILNDYSRVHNNRDAQREEAGVFEELIVGADIRTKDVKVLARAGSALWIEMSPLSIYRRDARRRYAWFYESYEADGNAKGYHTQKSFNRRNYGGRSTWPRKTFGGGHLDFYSLPFGLNGQFLVAEPVNNYPAAKRAATVGEYGDAEGLSSFSNPGLLFAGRLARKATIGDLEVGLNFLTYKINRDIYFDDGGGDGYNYAENTSPWTRRSEFNDIAPKIVEPTVYSLDFRGKLGNDYYFMGDIAMSQKRTETWKQAKRDGKFLWANRQVSNAFVILPSDIDPSRAITLENGETVYGMDNAEFDPTSSEYDLVTAEDSNTIPLIRYYDSIATEDLFPLYDPYLSEKMVEKSSFAPALYAKLAANTKMAYEVELVYMDPEFNSPYGISQDVVPVNTEHIKLGAGAYSYQANLAGANFVINPVVKRGFLKLQAGIHAQVKESDDFIRFQHKLIGRDLWKSSNSWSRTEPNMNFDEGRPYGTPENRGRLGDQSENRSRYMNEQQLGGLVGEDQALWEEFVPWEKEDLTEQQNGLTTTGAIPQSQKFSWTAGFDWGYDFGGTLPIFMNLNGEVSLLSRGANPSEDLLSGALLMGEPVIGLTPNFFLIGVFGYEGWYSKYGARNKKANYAPQGEPYLLGIDPALDAYSLNLEYHQFAMGLGFDWDFATRAGLHVRYKWAKHIDVSVNDRNDKFQDEVDEIKGLAKDNGGYSKAQNNRISQLQGAIVSNDFTAGFLFIETKIWF